MLAECQRMAAKNREMRTAHLEAVVVELEFQVGRVAVINILQKHLYLEVLRHENRSD